MFTFRRTPWVVVCLIGAGAVGTASERDEYCTSCGKKLKWGKGTCLDCKTNPKGERCTKCGVTLKFGKGTCASCKVTPQNCTKCGRQLMFGMGTCADCKGLKAGSCTSCGVQLQWGVGTCWPCKQRAMEAKAGSCAACGRKLKWGAGTCWDCKQGAMRDWASRPRSCTSCGTALRWGIGTCLDCKKQKIGALQQKFPDLRQKPWFQALEKRWQALESKVQAVISEYGPRIAAYVQSPEGQRQILETVAEVIALRRDLSAGLDSAKARAVELSLKAVGSLPIRTASGVKPLSEVLLEKIAEKCPYLLGTSITEDPASVILYGLVDPSPQYWLTEFKFVKTAGGEAVSVAEAAALRAGMDPDRMLKAIETIGHLEALSRGSLEPESVLACSELLAASLQSTSGESSLVPGGLRMRGTEHRYADRPRRRAA